ncbi:hypothetical protein Q2941_33500 [Bradyrhizobium sp. UFLA05-153]
MSADELLALGEDIQKHGLHEGVALCDGDLLDGRNRLEAMEMVGIKVVTSNGKLDIAFRNVKPRDPVDYVISKNIHRRHLSADQKRELISKLLKVTPEKSDRHIAEVAKVDHKTVASIRAKKVATGEIPHLPKTVGKDGRRRHSIKLRNATQPRTPKQPQLLEKANTSLDDAISAPIDRFTNAMPVLPEKPAVLEGLKAEQSQCVPDDPISICAVEVRSCVANAMHQIEYGLWPELIAKLHEELDRILREPAQTAAE